MAAVIAALLTVVFAVALKIKRNRIGFIWFFLIVLMATWAGGVWLKPFGPAVDGVRWLPFLTIGIFFAFLIAFFGPRKPPHGRRETIDKLEEIAREKELEQITYNTLHVFFWIVFIALVGAVIARYVV